MMNFMKNLSIAGGFLMIVVHGAGAYSLDNRRNAKVEVNKLSTEEEVTMARNDGGTEFVAGRISGGLVGAALALIFAPQSGEATRAQLKDKGIELKGRAIELSEEARQRAEELGDEVRKRAEELSAEARKRAGEVGAEARKRAAELESRGKVVLEEQRERLQEAVVEGKKAAASKKEELLSRLESAKAEDTAGAEA